MRTFISALFIALFISVSVTHAAAPAIVSKPVTYGFKTATNRTIDTVIVHATYNPALKTQTLAGAQALWKHDNVSPHYAIDKAGTIYRLVAEKNIAWHAGVSALPNGDTDVNTRSIGIELIYTNKETPTAAQYASLQSLLKDIESRYTIKYVLGHEQVSPGRKVDPWNFDYAKLTSVFKPATTVFVEPPTLSASIFQSSIGMLTAGQQAVMKQYSYRASCPVALDDLRVLNVSYYGFDGATHQGTIIVNASVADNTVAAFKALFEQRFPINQMIPIDSYQANDALSVSADNTSGFNCRAVSGTKTFSEHSYGTALDINPKENPSGSAVLKAGTGKGVVTPTIAKIFKDLGFTWGGEWTSKKDYQHFSVSGK
jgi:N-acetyl-anhydromuramyl-L-alanine amidase AmpD